MAYLKDAKGDWPQPAGMVPSWRGWPRGIIGPSPGYRVAPPMYRQLAQLKGCSACGGLGEDLVDDYNAAPDYTTGVMDAPVLPTTDDETDTNYQAYAAEAGGVPSAAPSGAPAAAGGGGVVLIGAAALAALLLLR